ncbi:hypothetical protein SH501x_000435 [Pirellulaceae bacterium SH501]
MRNAPTKLGVEASGKQPPASRKRATSVGTRSELAASPVRYFSLAPIAANDSDHLFQSAISDQKPVFNQLLFNPCEIF